jgi:hypothetical protein
MRALAFVFFICSMQIADGQTCNEPIKYEHCRRGCAENNYQCKQDCTHHQSSNLGQCYTRCDDHGDACFRSCREANPGC